jgi:hypothetical protein
MQPAIRPSGYDMDPPSLAPLTAAGFGSQGERRVRGAALPHQRPKIGVIDGLKSYQHYTSY